MAGPLAWMRRKAGLGPLGRNTLLYGSGLGIRAIVQAAYLILLSRWMGPEGYGYFAGSVAAAVILSPLAGCGVSYLVASRVGRDRGEMGGMWATSLVQIGWTGALLAMLVLAASWGWLDQRLSLSAMAMLAVAEIVALPLANAAAGLSLAADRGLGATLATTLVPLGRLAMAGALVAGDGVPTPDRMATMHLLGSLLGAAAASGLVLRLGGRPDWTRRLPALPAAREGLSYALGTLVGVSYLEIDKVVLLQSQEAATAGAYTVAFRAASLLALPMTALMAAATPRLFAMAGTAGLPRLRRAMAASVLAYSVLAAGVALFAAPALPWIFGATYADAVGYLRLLSIWLPLFGLHQYAGTLLTTSGGQVARVVTESAGMAALLALYLAWIPRAGPMGAVGSLVLVEVMMVVACAAWVWRRR